jgi:iron(III) transport system permease protein
LSKISRNVDVAARTLGATVSEMLFRVHLSLLRPALGAAALIVFVDSMKELPATLLLRPFNFDTLSTQVFTLVSLYRYEEAGLSALSIVVVSLAPVLLLHRIIAGSRQAVSASPSLRQNHPPNWRCASLDNPTKCVSSARHEGLIGLDQSRSWRLDRPAQSRARQTGG